MDAISEARLNEIMPQLADKIRQMAGILEAEGIYIRVVQALRSWVQQDMLYAKGRTSPGLRVTNAEGGYSYHNFGMAADVCPSSQPPGQPFKPDWNPAHPQWQRIMTLGLTLGLTEGALWTRANRDLPHLQLTGRFPENAPDDEVRQLFRDGGMQAVWAEALV